MHPYFYAMSFGIERYAIGIGISALGDLTREMMKKPPNIRVALPDSLMRLVELARDGSQEHQEFLHAIVAEFRLGEIDTEATQLTENIYHTLNLLRESNSLIAITNEDIDEEIAFYMDESFDEERYFISLSPRSNFVEDYYLKLLSWAKRTGGLLVERSSYIFQKVGSFVATLQLPDRFDDFVQAKKKHIDKVFSFRGGQGVKWFLAAVFGSAGLIHPILGAPSLLIAYMDP